MDMRFSIFSWALVATVSAGSASAEPMVLDCRVHAAKPGFERNGIRRLQIDLAAKSFTVLDNTGKGFVMRGTRPIAGVSGERIVLENSGGKASTLDRRTGEYSFKNDAEKLMIHGHCKVLGRDSGPI